MNIITILLLFFSFTGTTHSGDFLKQFVKPEATPKFFVSVIEEWEKLLDELKKEKESRDISDKLLSEKLTRQIEEIKVLFIKVDNSFKENPEDELLLKQQSLLKESEQVIKDTQRALEDCSSTLRDLIDKLTLFLDDTEFEGFKKKHKLQERHYYSFEDLQLLHENILDYERRVAQLQEQEKSIRTEKDNRKRNLAILHEGHDKKVQDAQAAADTIKEEGQLNNENEHEKHIAKLEEQLYKYQKNLHEIHLKEINYKVTSINFQLFIVKSHLDLFKKHLRAIKSSIHVSEADVFLAEEEFAKEQRNYFDQKDILRYQSEKVIRGQKIKEKEINELSKKLGITLGNDVDEWTKKPKQTADSYLSYIQMGLLSVELSVFMQEKNVLDGQMALHEEKINYIKIKTEAKKTYHTIESKSFDKDQITQLNGQYEAKKKNTEEKHTLYQTKINAISNLLNQLKKVLDRATALRSDAEKQKDIIFKDKTKEYTKFMLDLDHAEKGIKRQIDLLGKLNGIYSGMLSELNSTIRLIDFINTELQTNTIWYRPSYAITIDGIKNIMSDINAFLIDVRMYITQFNGKLFIAQVKKAFSVNLAALLFFIKIIACFLLFFFLRKNEQHIINIFFIYSQKHGSLVSISCFIIGVLLLFIRSCYRSLFLWICIGLFVNMMTDYYITIIFYLLSIPYLFYSATRLVKFLMLSNKEYNYILLPEDFQRRFELVFSTLLYVSVMIFFFRQAFMLSNVYLRSELPNILLAVNFIILQISLIFLITKEQIMGIIPESTSFWRWIYAQVDHYYYLILLFVVAIIVMSNPYVGFGRLILYLLSGSIQMLLLIKILSVLHDFVKRVSSLFLFAQDDTVMRERFAYAKTYFGLVIISSFVVFGFIGFIVTAKIWGWDIGFYDLHHWLSVPLLLEGTTHPITPISLLKLIVYLFSGFAIAYGLKEYVLAKIFDLLLVESGVQHTVTSIIQYIVIIIAVFIGFQSVGLGLLIGNVFMGLALGIGWYIKDPISDFVSYFIILVQRPVKIGDYVQIDSETMGVVRKITPRSVILRRKNSTTIVVPNSYIVSKSIENWNYVRNFIAINDIQLFVYFKEDPARVKELLQQAAEEHAKVLKNPRSIVRLMNFSECGYEFMVRCFVSSTYTLEMWDIGSDIRLLIAKAFKENNIEFAIPMYKVDEFNMHYETKFAKERAHSPTMPSDSKNIKE